MFFAIFFQILGVGLFSISVTTVVLYTNFFTTTCGTVNGRVCNNRGTCGEGGFCICDPIFNGLTCEDTRAPAYDSSTGTVCNGNGMASPLLLKNQIPSVCFQNTPTAANGFDMSGPGWGDQGCINYVQTAMDRYAIGDYSLMEGVPTCACFPGFGGLDCGLNYCPQDSNFDVCSGNGNTSVGIVRNDTTTGNGCQCDNYLSLYNLVSLLTTPELAIVTGKYLDDFRQGFCGTPIRAGSSLIIKSQQPDYVCYCQALYTGEACEYGVCPENQGIICSGHGNPDLGFGLLRGVTSNELIGVNPADCTVVCTPPAIYCNGRCTSPFECNVKYEVCPITQPYRCATGACVSGSTPHCDMSYETGTWDDITNMPHSIECSLATVAAQPSFLRRRRKMEACFGIGSYNTIDGFIASNIPFTTSSRIMAIDIMLFDESNKSMISVSYGGVIYNTTGEFHYRLDLLRSETQVIEDYFQLVPMIVKANRLSPERVVITPNPYLIYPQVASFRFQASEYIVGIYDHSFNTLSTTGDMFIAIDPNSNLAFNYQGNLVNQQSCLNTISGCLWFITTYSSVDGSKFVCKTGTSYVVQNSPCALQYNVTGNFVATNMIISTNNSWSYVDPFAQWKTYIAVTTPIIPPVSIFSTSPITNIQFLLEEDIHHICICPPYGINQSALNENWLSETSTRDLAVNTGEYVVGRRQVNGYITTVRGIVQESNTLLIASGSNQYLLEETGLVISSLEYQSGTPDDDININPIRCINGSNSILEWKLIENVRQDCVCGISRLGLSCTCMNGFNETYVCTQDDCEYGWRDLLEEYCFWSPQTISFPRATGFKQVGDTDAWVSTDFVTFPLVIVISGCNDSAIFTELPFQVECVDQQTYLYPVHSFNTPSKQWTIHTNSTILQADFYDNYGGISVLEIPFSTQVWASSTLEGDAANVANTSRQTWRSTDYDHQSSIGYNFEREFGLVSVFVEIVTAGIHTVNISLPANIYVQASLTGTPDSWVTLGQITSQVVDGNLRYTIPLNNEDRVWNSIRLHSYFPMKIRTFIPFIDQNCTVGRITGSQPSFQSGLVSLFQNPPDVSSYCVCTDTCVLDGVSVAQDGHCDDIIYYGRGGNLSVGINVCAAGTDCSDCGCNTRNVTSNPALICADADMKEILQRFSHIPATTINTLWTVHEFVILGQASLLFNYTTMTGSSFRWKRSYCTEECPFVTCLDGSCADTFNLCPQTLYNCPGNGCVRATIELNEYYCACEQGRGGLQCELTTCTPGDPETGLISPHKWCSCNGPSPLKLKPPYELIIGGSFRAFLDQDILRINRPSGRISSMDVGWVNIRAEKAPYGIPFLRLYERQGTNFYTTCPYQVRSSSGIFLELEQCALSRQVEFPHEVIEWSIIWHNETHYDDAPYRCPSGHCVGSERDCYGIKLRDPPCGNSEATCLVDGTCKCPYGKRTFIINEDLTAKLLVPYAHKGDLMQTTVWGQDNDNRYVSAWCQARNCSEVDCTPPYGCFPGTPSLNFADRTRLCTNPPNKGLCAFSLDDCKTGNIFQPTICSGNGQLRQRDYRSDEWYCECGSVVDGVFRSNGYGGILCQDYSCQDSVNLYYSRRQPFNLQVYTDINGFTLPGKWIGPCGATVGANPDDIIEWNRCCPGVTQLEKCTTIPCTVGGVTKCLDIDQCQGLGRSPLVEVCNGKGTALADGTCNCQENDETGVGYTFDLSVYSTKGCYLTVKCNTATTSGTVCNQFPACSDFSSWMDLPVIPYLWNQAYTYAAREGFAPTNETIVRKVTTDHLLDVVAQTYVNVAINLLSEQHAAASCICVLSARDNCTDPPGMLPCGNAELVYMKALPTPYILIDEMTVLNHPTLQDRRIVADAYTQSLNANQSNVFQLSIYDTLEISFANSYTIDIIRIHGYISALTNIRYIGDMGSDVCQPTIIPAFTDYKWYDVFCILSYSPARFDLFDSVGWNSNCLNNENSALCQGWMQVTCPLIPLATIQSPNSLIYYQGCGSALCCVASTKPFLPTFLLLITFSQTVIIDEVVVFGHGKYAVPIPPAVKARFQALTGQSACVDERVFFDPTLGFLGQSSFFRPSAPLVSRDASFGTCSDNGGVLASYLTDPSSLDIYASPMGTACYYDSVNDVWRPVNSVGCHVDARDTREVQNPIDMSHFFNTACSLYGCWGDDSSSNTHNFHHDPYNGTQYNVPQFTGQVDWNTFFTAVMAKKNLQESPTVLKSRLFETILTQDSLINQFFNDGTFQAAFDAADFSAYFTLMRDLPQPQAANGPTFPVDGTPVTFWEDDYSCDITFHSVPNCAGWCFLQFGSNCPSGTCEIRGMEGSSFTLHIGPQNYDQYFLSTPGNPMGILDQLFDTNEDDDNCAQTNPIITDYFSPEFTVNGNFDKYYGTNPSYPGKVRYFRSISIRGKCEVRVQGGVTNKYFYDNTFTSHDHVGATPNFFETGFLPVPYAYQGCYPQVFQGSHFSRIECEGYVGITPATGMVYGPDCQNGNVNYCPFVADDYIDAPGDLYSYTLNPEINGNYINQNVNGLGSNLGADSLGRINRDCTCCDSLGFPDTLVPRDQVNSIQFIPLFTNTKIKMTVKAPQRDKNQGTDEAELGYLDHLYMPIVMKVEQIEWINYGSTTGIYTIDNVILVDNQAYGAFATSGSNFFVGSNTPFKAFDGTHAGIKTYHHCPDCIINTVGNYQFYQETVEADNYEFNNILSDMNQDLPDGTDILTTPRMAVNWTNPSTNVTSLSFIPDLNGTAPYGRMISRLRASDYNVVFAMEYCVQVVRVSGLYQFQFRPVLCNTLLYALCIQDTNKYAVQSGYQCDACGPSCRTEVIQPNTTVYDLFPDLSRVKDPLGYQILDAYLDGTLDALLARSDLIPWDKVILQLKNVSLLHAFPEAVADLKNGVSTRPRLTSFGQTAQPYNWVDLALASRFPVDCGAVLDPKTGKATRRCAISQEHCNPANDFDGQQMAYSEIPTLFTQMQTSSSTNTLCTVPIKPSEFQIYTTEGAPQPSNDQFEVLSTTTDSIKLRALQTNATWTNSGRPLVAPLTVPFTVIGNIQVSVNVGFYRLWVGSLSPNFITPVVLEYITPVTPVTQTTFQVSYTPISDILEVFGYEFTQLQEASLVTLSTVLLSNVETLAFCQSMPNISWVELPSHIQSFAPDHHCDFTQGVCYCAPNSPFGGPDCEWPTVTTPDNGKEICNGFGDDGGLALLSDLATGPVISQGVYYDSTSQFGCKCQNIGLMIETILRPSSAFDFGFVLRRDLLPNAPDFVLVTIPSDIPVPVSASNVQEVCNSDSASLPSWNTGDEAVNIVEMEVLGIFVDLVFLPDDPSIPTVGSFQWAQLEQEFASPDTNFTTLINNPCPNHDPVLCTVLNWNNIAFNRTGNPFVDGSDLVFTANNFFTVKIPPTTDVSIELYVAGTQYGVLLAANGQACIITSVSDGLVTADCLFPSITTLVFSEVQETTRQYQEVKVFLKVDTGRVAGYF